VKASERSTFHSSKERPVHRKTLTVESKPQREGQKSRSFSVELLAYVIANDLWELGSTAKERCYRPVFMAYAGTEQGSRAFAANLRCGRSAVVQDTGLTTRFELPRSAGFRYETFSQAGATLTLAYLPSVFSFQPAVADSGSISFLCIPPTWWVDEQAETATRTMGADAREAAIAAYFVAYLDQRSPLPIANDLGFHLKLYRAALEEDWCCLSSGSESRPGSLFHIGLESVGFEPAIYCQVDHSRFAQFLKTQTASHLPRFKEVLTYGTPGIHRPRRVLPDSRRPAVQLSLFG
jgi:hypothetical protein